MEFPLASEDIARRARSLYCPPVDADQIFVLANGRIVERGAHAALVGRDGVYADLYKKQFEEELAAS